MSDSRTHILASIRQSLASAKLPERPAVTLTPPKPVTDRSALADQFAVELQALLGKFMTVRQAEAAEVIVQLVRERNAGRVLAWSADQLPVPELWDALHAAGLAMDFGEVDREAQRAARLKDEEQIVVGVTGADAALAETATLALIAGPGRPRLAAMSVRTHIALITPDQLYPSLAAWLASAPDLSDRLRDRSQLVLISGPSRTADIEMTLTVGVHGPGEVIALLVQA